MGNPNPLRVLSRELNKFKGKPNVKVVALPPNLEQIWFDNFDLDKTVYDAHNDPHSCREILDIFDSNPHKHQGKPYSTHHMIPASNYAKAAESRMLKDHPEWEEIFRKAAEEYYEQEPGSSFLNYGVNMVRSIKPQKSYINSKDNIVSLDDNNHNKMHWLESECLKPSVISQWKDVTKGSNWAPDFPVYAVQDKPKKGVVRNGKSTRPNKYVPPKDTLYFPDIDSAAKWMDNKWTFETERPVEKSWSKQGICSALNGRCDKDLLGGNRAAEGWRWYYQDDKPWNSGD